MKFEEQKSASIAQEKHTREKEEKICSLTASVHSPTTTAPTSALLDKEKVIEILDAENKSTDAENKIHTLIERLSRAESRFRVLAERLDVQAVDTVASQDAFLRSIPGSESNSTADTSGALGDIIQCALGTILEEVRRKTRAWLAEVGGG